MIGRSEKFSTGDEEFFIAGSPAKVVLGYIRSGRNAGLRTRLTRWQFSRLRLKASRPRGNSPLLSFVRLALRRPYTAAVAALLIALLGVLSVTRMIVDIFPVIDIPVVMVVWSYPGLSATDMERRVTLITERAYSTTVNGISRIESQSIPGVGLLKV
jgi:hypothetical protein